MAGSSPSTPAQGPRTPEGYAAARDQALKRAVEIREMVARNTGYFELATSADDAARIVGGAQARRLPEHGERLSDRQGPDAAQDVLRSRRADDRPGAFLQQRSRRFRDRSEGPEWNGLSQLGKEFVAEANRLGIVIDASHASDLAFDQMLALSTTPIILSHSGAKAVFNHPRNIDDERIRKLAAAGGVIQINSYSDYMVRVPETPELDAAMRALGQKYGPYRTLAGDDVPGLCARAARDRSAISGAARDDERSDGAHPPYAEAGGPGPCRHRSRSRRRRRGHRDWTMSRASPRSRGGCSRRDTARAISPRSGAAMCCALLREADAKATR